MRRVWTHLLGAQRLPGKDDSEPCNTLSVPMHSTIQLAMQLCSRAVLISLLSMVALHVDYAHARQD